MSHILYNITLGVSEQIHQEWLEWMKQTHIPEVLQTGMFLSARLLKVNSDHISTPTYAVQYLCESIERYAEYQRIFGPALQETHQRKYGEHAHAIRTVLEIVDEFEAPTKN
jgi:hypothetical protein